MFLGFFALNKQRFARRRTRLIRVRTRARTRTRIPTSLSWQNVKRPLISSFASSTRRQSTKVTRNAPPTAIPVATSRPPRFQGRRLAANVVVKSGLLEHPKLTKIQVGTFAVAYRALWHSINVQKARALPHPSAPLPSVRLEQPHSFPPPHTDLSFPSRPPTSSTTSTEQRLVSSARPFEEHASYHQSGPPSISRAADPLQFPMRDPLAFQRFPDRP